MTGLVLSEKELQQQIVDLAEICGWRVNHVFPLRTKHGWKTSTTWKGWPDLTLVRPPDLLFIEVKGPAGCLTPEQTESLALLNQLPNARALAVWPKDWDTVEKLITARRRQ